MEDAKILDLYWQRDDEAIIQTERKYGTYCLTISDNILHDRQDAEECVNDTWMQAWQTIPPTRPGVLRLFLARITRNLSINRYYSRQTQKRGGGETALVLEELKDCLAATSDVENDYLAKELGESIRLFVRQLPKREANVFVRRYFFTESMADIAARYVLTENYVMVILSRTRKKLKLHLEQEGYFHE